MHLLRDRRVQLAIYLMLIAVEILVVRQVTDLASEMANWQDKSREILSLRVPTSNFYGPGSALMLIPFLWNGPTYFFAILGYGVGGAFFYFKLCDHITNQKWRLLALLALPANFYLVWQFYSSQDTVFEFFLLNIALWALISQRWTIFIFSTYILAETRSQYWVLLLSASIVKIYLVLKNKQGLRFRYVLAFPLLALTMIFNYVNYGSPSPALEGGITAEMSYSKYYYLSHPKFDVDVFLSGPNGPLPPGNAAKETEGMSAAQIDKYYASEAFRSIKENPKETILGWMQKIDSYAFDTQKIPHLPGSYLLNTENMTIEIGDERLQWQLVIGNLFYQLYRSILIVLGLIGFGMWFAYRHNNRFRTAINPISWLALPWICGLVPGVLIYTETRFKIVAELLLFPLVAMIYSKFREEEDSARNPPLGLH
jgi:hypothetical protein